jgi:hypothetical protein
MIHCSRRAELSNFTTQSLYPLRFPGSAALVVELDLGPLGIRSDVAPTSRPEASDILLHGFDKVRADAPAHPTLNPIAATRRD